MLVRNGAGPVTAGAVNEARRFLAAGNGRTFKPTTRKPQASCAIRAELTGSSSCKAAGITAHGSVLALCQLLVQAGFNPDRAASCLPWCHALPDRSLDRRGSWA